MRESMKNDWLDSIKARMEKYEAYEPPGLWEEIDLRIDYRVMGRRRLFLSRIIKPFSIAAVTLVVCVIAWTVCDFEGLQNGRRIPLLAYVTPFDVYPEPQPKDNQEVDVQFPVLSYAYNHIVVPTTGDDEPLVGETGVSTAIVGDVTESDVTETAESVDMANNAIAELKSEHQARDVELAKIALSRQARRDVSPAMSSKLSRKHFSIGTYATNITSYDFGDGMQSPSAHMSALPHSDMSYYTTASIGIDRDVLHALSETEIRYVHRMPVRIGLTFSYGLRQNLDLESGLVYSYLASDVDGGMGLNTYEATRHLHYLGVPLKLRFSFVEVGPFLAYVSGGLMAEKCVGGRLKALRKISGQPERYEETSVSIRPLQWSFNVSAGASLRLYKTIGLYVEPGVSCYVDNHSGVSTIYNDRPVDFNFTAGIRFGIGR